MILHAACRDCGKAKSPPNWSERCARCAYVARAGHHRQQWYAACVECGRAKPRRSTAARCGKCARRLVLSRGCMPGLPQIGTPCCAKPAAPGPVAVKYATCQSCGVEKKKPNISPRCFKCGAQARAALQKDARWRARMADIQRNRKHTTDNPMTPAQRDAALAVTLARARAIRESAAAVAA